MSPTVFFICAHVLLLVALGFASARAYGVDARLGWLVYPTLLFSGACLVSKRLHDLGRAGWWGFLIVWAVIEFGMRVEASHSPITPLGYLAGLILVATEIVLVFIPGQRGQNRFGPNPAEARQRSGPSTK